MTSSADEWVDEVARTTHPDRVVWCDGSEAENARLIDEMLSDGTLSSLNQDALPNCYLHRSNPQDVARTEHLTYICTDDPQDVGPTNNWSARMATGALPIDPPALRPPLLAPRNEIMSSWSIPSPETPIAPTSRVPR